MHHNQYIQRFNDFNFRYPDKSTVEKKGKITPYSSWVTLGYLAPSTSPDIATNIATKFPCLHLSMVT